MTQVRDEAWLYGLLDDIWDRFFSDVSQENTVRIRFGRKAKTRLGSIMRDRQDPGTTIITVNSLFKDEQIPESIVRATIVHELSHYAHGFNSPLQQQFSFPHADGVMRREFKERGLEDLYVEQKAWLKANWPTIVQQNFAPSRVRVVKRATKVPKPFWFGGGGY